MMGTRNMFAWSFDRLAPEGLTTVSDRFHTPVLATITVGVIVEGLNYLNVYQGLGSFLLNALVVMAVAFIIVSAAAAVTPWRRPGMHAQAPGWAQVKIAGLPVITLVAVISAVSWGFVLWVALHTGISSVGLKPMLEAFAIPAAGIIYYIGVRLVRNAQGMQLSQAFAEIPPE
jgi:amino acid transporter